MKFSASQFRNLTLTTLLSIVPALHAQTTATTTPVGVINVTIPAAANASTPSNTTLSIPLYAPADYISTVATIPSATEFTLTGAAWQAGQFAVASAPRFVRIKASTTVPANIGRIFLVSANTTNQLTVTLADGVTDIHSVLSVGDVCEVLPANTLGTVFGTTTPVLHADPDPALADNVYILNAGEWEIYYHNGTNWRKSGGLGNKNDTIMYPDEGMFIVRVLTSPVVLTLRGTVPSTAERTDLAGTASTFLANRFPVDTQLVNTGIHLTPDWVTGAAEDADLVYAWNGGLSEWEIFYHNGTSWRKAGGLGNKDTTVIPSATAIVVSRKNGTVTLSQPLPYTP